MADKIPQADRKRFAELRQAVFGRTAGKEQVEEYLRLCLIHKVGCPATGVDDPQPTEPTPPGIVY